jgi:para-nitrobenzyl esterase
MRSLCAAEDRAGITIPKYYYLFGSRMPGWDNPGAFHSSDLWFFFETLAKCWRPFTGPQYDLARVMCNYWANFIKTGDPNGVDADGTPMAEWPPFTEKKPYVMHFYDEKEKFGAKLDEPDELTRIFVDKIADDAVKHESV